METNEKRKKTVLRIALSESTAKILSDWKSNLEAQFPGMRVSFPDLVGWAMERVGVELSKKDAAALRERFFDKVKQLEWLLSQAKAAKARGESLSVSPHSVKNSKSVRETESSIE